MKSIIDRKNTGIAQAILTILFLGLGAVLASAEAATQRKTVDFDHTKTGFQLSGQHANVPCESCHIRGVFKGTPTLCITCHVAGSKTATTAKNTTHIPTTAACDQCHTSKISWTGARFRHTDVRPGTCVQCHNGAHMAMNALGKPAKHPVTSDSCDVCHSGYTSFAGAGFNHTGVKAGQCATCHGVSAKGKASNHVPTTLSCDTCHRTGGSFTPSTFTHSTAQGIVPGKCADCHNGAYTAWNAKGKPNNHVPTGLTCDACHRTGGSFTPSTFTHTASQGIVPGKCADCHNGGYTVWNAMGKPMKHPVTSDSCDKCHTGYTSFAGAGFNHTGVVPGQCATCHGVSAKAKPTNHVPTNLSCDACHRTGGSFSPSTFTHTASQGIVPGKCADCHNGAYTAWNAKGKPNNHVPTGLTCDACHRTGGSFTPSTFTHTASQGIVPGKCADCHNGAYTAWNAMGKSNGHVATTDSCDKCHTGYTSFAGAGFNHVGVVPGQCATCHGISAKGKPNNHIPTNLSCDACHRTGGSFSPSTFTHTASQGIVPGKCVDCHNGGYTAWNALGKPNNHVPTSLACDACHKVGSTFTMATFAHTTSQGIVPGKCVDCHNGAYPSAKAKPSNHIPYASQLLASPSMNCDTCHKNFTSFTSVTMNHNGSQGNGSGWCKGCHASGTNYLGNMQKKSLTHESSTGVTDCSQSGCHRPLGTKGAAYTKWD